MKKFVVYLFLALLGVVIVIGSALNEGGTVGGAWAGVVYALVVSAFVALFDKKAIELPWKETGWHMATIFGASVLAAIAYTIF